jgi:hypothetical protein
MQQPIKMQRTDAAPDPVVPLPHMQQPDMVPHSQAGYQQPGMMQVPPQQQYPPDPLRHSILGPDMQMHPHELSAPADQLQEGVPMHAVQQQAQQSAAMPQHTAVPPVPTASGGDGVPAPPSEGGSMFDVPPPVAQNSSAIVGPAPVTSIILPGAYQHAQQVDVMHQHDGSGQQGLASMGALPADASEGKVGDLFGGAADDGVVSGAPQHDMQPAGTHVQG